MKIKKKRHALSNNLLPLCFWNKNLLEKCKTNDKMGWDIVRLHLKFHFTHRAKENIKCYFTQQTGSSWVWPTRDQTCNSYTKFDSLQVWFAL